MEIGAGAIIDNNTLRKLINIQMARYRNNIKEISTELEAFEKEYSM